MKMNHLGIVRRVYNKILRPYLPYKISVHNGVPVRGQVRLLDVTDEFPEYEDSLVSGIRECVKDGDDVIVVGGGIGVSTVAATNATGRRGSVTTYEASHSQYQRVLNTIGLNGVEEYTRVEHAIVGPFSDKSLEKYGEPGDAEIKEPSTLPEANVLVLDCEGAEVTIIEEMSHQPRWIVVETHGFLGTTEQEVKKSLSEAGYEVVRRQVDSQQRGIYVLTAKRSPE